MPIIQCLRKSSPGMGSAPLTASYARRPFLDHLDTDWARTKPAPLSDLNFPDPSRALGTPSLVELGLPLARYLSPRQHP